jgi:hypothetical protein
VSEQQRTKSKKEMRMERLQGVRDSQTNTYNSADEFMIDDILIGSNGYKDGHKEGNNNKGWKVNEQANVRTGNDWHRVRVLELRNNQVLVEFMGRGLRRWLSLDRLERPLEGTT